MHHAPSFAEAGRHLVSTDPAARPERKLAHVSHEELADERSLNPDHLRRARHYGVHHHGWWYAENPRGGLPPDLERLAQRCPAAKREEPLPSRPMRLLVRTWAWLRFWPRLGQGLVQTVDKHFERLVPILVLPLLAAELSRYASARWQWRWLQSLCPAAPNPGHNHSELVTGVSA
jgi:beta-1,4-mannosyl-glycoprotein beta-1,4-N-acetylglucosaminyltransferase